MTIHVSKSVTAHEVSNSKQQKEDGSDVSLNMFVSLLRKGFYLLCALMLFGFSSTNLNFSVYYKHITLSYLFSKQMNFYLAIVVIYIFKQLETHFFCKYSVCSVTIFLHPVYQCRKIGCFIFDWYCTYCISSTSQCFPAEETFPYHLSPEMDAL